MDRIKELYENSGYPGGKRLYDIAKKEGVAVTQKQVDDFVKAQEVHQLHAKAPKPAVSHPIVTSGPEMELTCDLLDMTKYTRNNGGMGWIFLCEDVFSRKAYAEAIQNKKPESVLPAMKHAIEKLGKPLTVVSDQGGEWAGEVKRWLWSQQIHNRQAELYSHNQLGLINALSKFYKNAIHKHMTHKQSTRYIEYLSTLTNSYNATPHSTLKGMTPNEADKDQTSTREIHLARMDGVNWKPKFKIGDYVRVLKTKKVFDRGYETRFSIKVYEIKGIDGTNYLLEDGRKFREFMLKKSHGHVQKKEDKKDDEEKKEEEPKRDIISEAKAEKKTEDILKFKEGVSQQNVRRSNRERAPSAAMQFQAGVDPAWYKL